MKRLAILGATGSIGESTLDVVARHPDKYEVTALAANGNAGKLAALCERFRPRYAALADAGAAERLAAALAGKGLPTEVLGGPESLERVACAPETDAVMAAVRQAFKPEFLNRLDEVVVFDPLSTEELARIVELQVRALSARLADRRITLEVTEAAKEWLALTGYDPAYGARPLRRLVQREIGDRLARALLAGEVRDGSTVTVDRDETADSLVLR